jgi:hypothetical protein
VTPASGDPLERTLATLGQDEFSTAVEQGRRMTLAEAMELIAELGDDVNTPRAS